MAIEITSTSGFLILLLIVITLTLPYTLRRQMRAAGMQVSTVWQRMKTHYWIGYAILALTLLHMYVSMGSGMLRRTNTLGIDLAVLGLLMIFAQVALGMNLERAGGRRRRSLRKLHFALMLGIVSVILLHVALNGILLQALIHG